MFCKTSKELFTSKIKNIFIKQRITISRIKSNLVPTFVFKFQSEQNHKKQSRLLNTALTHRPESIRQK